MQKDEFWNCIKNNLRKIAIPISKITKKKKTFGHEKTFNM